MLLRPTYLIVALACAVAGCSKNPENAVSAAPTAPTVLASLATATGASGPMAASGPMDVALPPRNETVDFRRQLETKYQTTLQRPVTLTAVDPDGDAIWVEEYIRYRINGCDHATATQRTLEQIDGAAAAAVCNPASSGPPVSFPTRVDTVDFRRQLDAKYVATGRSSSSSAVDPEGSAIWTQEYLRYRTNSCSHAQAVQNVLTQIDGNPAPATCYVPSTCSFRVWPGLRQTVAATAVSSSVELLATGSSCTWTATTNVSWITLGGTKTGGDRETQTFTVAQNTGGPRTGFIYFNWNGGSERVVVDQNSSVFNLTFQFFDYAQTTNAVTECRVRMATHTCTLSSSTTALPGAVTTYDWRVEYSYNTQQVKTQATSSSTFGFQQACGGTDTNGTVVDVTVRLTVTDAEGNTATVYSGQGFQPALTLRIYPCS